MIDQPVPMSDLPDLPDWQSLNETRTELLPEHFQVAARLSKSIPSQQRWQVYLCALGVLGFEQWLKERATRMHFQQRSASIWQPAYANLLAAACNIQVGSFKLCLITSNNLTDQHSIPFAVFDIPDFAAHFYVLMQVEEEKQQVAVSGFMSYQQYQHYQQTARLQVDSDWTYTLPSTWFNLDPDALLLNLRCLEADAIQLPAPLPAVKNNTTIALRQKLEKIKFQLQTQHPWELLTVKEGTTLLSNPGLVDWVYQAASGSFALPLINVGDWLRNRLDPVAQELGWMLMPSLALSKMRSLEEDFDKIRAGLEQQEIHIPPTARGAFRDLDYERGGFRLYAIMWVLSETTEPEWMLLIALGSQPQAQMPKTLKLEVRDETQLLFTQSLSDTSQGVLYAQVIGNCNERFWVSVTADDEAVFEIPPFGLELEGRI